MKEKIIFINALSAKLGGGKTYIINLLRYLPNNVLIYICCPDRFMLPDDPRVIYLESNFANKSLLHRAFWEIFSLPFVLKNLKVELLFVPGGMDFTLSTFAIPKVTMFRNMLPFDPVALTSVSSRLLILKNYILKKLMIRTMNSAAHTIFISEYAKKSIQPFVKLNSSSVIYHGIAKEFIPSETVIDEGVGYILYVSRFEPYKNHLNVIKAYEKLSPSIRAKYKLVLVGEFMEPSYGQCIKYVKDNNLEEFVDIKGKVPYEKLPALYQQATVFVFASSCENCPNILLEAIGCGAPIISSRTEPMPEFARNSALYFDETDFISIYQELDTVLNNETMIKQMREKSIALREFYTWENTALLTWQCLESIGEKNV